MKHLHSTATAIAFGLREDGFSYEEARAEFRQHGILSKFEPDIAKVYGKDEEEPPKTKEKRKDGLSTPAEEYTKDYVKDLARRAREGDQDAYAKLKEMRDNGLVQAELALEEVDRQNKQAKQSPKKPTDSAREPIALAPALSRALDAWSKLTPQQREILGNVQKASSPKLADQMLESRRNRGGR
jgi:hypothetical protein